MLVTSVSQILPPIHSKTRLASRTTPTPVGYLTHTNMSTTTTTGHFSAINLDASWDHGMLSEEDAMWLQAQHEADLSKDWLREFSAEVALDITGMAQMHTSITTDPTNLHQYIHHSHLQQVYHEYAATNVPTVMNTAMHAGIDIKQEVLSDEDYFTMSGLDAATMTKEELRKHKNRASAARSRTRTRERLEQLEHMVAELEAKNQLLQQTLSVMQYEQQVQHSITPGM